jgi:hypothetical protein
MNVLMYMNVVYIQINEDFSVKQVHCYICYRRSEETRSVSVCEQEASYITPMFYALKENY